MSTTGKLKIKNYLGGVLVDADIKPYYGETSSNSKFDPTVVPSNDALKHAINKGAKAELSIGNQKVSIPITSLDFNNRNLLGDMEDSTPEPFNNHKTYPNFDPDALVIFNKFNVGFNIGQCLEVLPNYDLNNATFVNEGRYGAFAGVEIREEHFRRWKEAGFDHVRIPINFNHAMPPFHEETDGTPIPQVLNPTIMNNFMLQVDMAVNLGLGVIVDYHYHNGMYCEGNSTGEPGYWLNSNKNIPATRLQLMNRLRATIQEIATYLYTNVDKYPVDQVLFEIFNEPQSNFNTDWDAEVVSFIQAARAGHPNIILLVGGKYWNNPFHLQYLPNLDFDDRVALTSHNYQPHQQWSHNMNPLPGYAHVDWTEEFKQALQDAVDACVNATIQHGKPVFMTEASHMRVTYNEISNRYYRDLRNMHMKAGIPVTFWNDYGLFATYMNTGVFFEGASEAMTGKKKSVLYYDGKESVVGENVVDLTFASLGTNGGVVRTTERPQLFSWAGGPVGYTVLSEDTLRIDSLPVNANDKFTIMYLPLKGSRRPKSGDTVTIKCLKNGGNNGGYFYLAWRNSYAFGKNTVTTPGYSLSDTASYSQLFCDTSYTRTLPVDSNVNGVPFAEETLMMFFCLSLGNFAVGDTLTVDLRFEN